MAALLCALVLLQWLPGVNSSYLWLAAALAAVAVLVTRLEDGPARLISLNLFVWAMLVRVAAVATCHLLAVADGGVMLGPDSSTYLEMSRALAMGGFQLETVPPVYFGTYNVGHYYLFAAGIRYFDADLFGLQVMNGGLVALAAPLAFGFSRILVPSAAALIGLAVALNPNLIVLSSIDLLKDPSIVSAMALLIWAVVRSTHEDRMVRLAGYAAAALVAALYIRTVRFYALGYFEVSLIVAAAVIVLTRRELVRRFAAVPVTVLVLLAVEVLPMQLSWPPTPVLIMSHVRSAVPALTQYAPGLVDVLAAEAAEIAPAAAASASSTSNLFRRLFGPFVWVQPPEWSFSVLRAGDYLLYPGMLFWYALLPFVGVGIFGTAHRILTRSESRFGVIFLWLFTVLYFAQYLTINLSYRQRDVMLPILLVFACLGGAAIGHSPGWRRFYRAYWLALVIVACAHLTARHLLGA